MVREFQFNKNVSKYFFYAVGYVFLFTVVWLEKGISSALVAVPFLLVFQLNIFFIFKFREVKAGLLASDKLYIVAIFLILLVNAYICYRLRNNLVFYSILWVLPLLVYFFAKLILLVSVSKKR